MSPLDATNASYIMGFIDLVSSRWDTATQYPKGLNISVTRLRYSANHNVPDSWPIRAQIASQNYELCRNHCVLKSQNNNVQYVENNVFNLEPCKHTALQQKHKIMFFLATSYDPFNNLNENFNLHSIRYYCILFIMYYNTEVQIIATICNK